MPFRSVSRLRVCVVKRLRENERAREREREQEQERQRDRERASERAREREVHACASGKRRACVSACAGLNENARDASAKAARTQTLPATTATTPELTHVTALTKRALTKPALTKRKHRQHIGSEARARGVSKLAVYSCRPLRILSCLNLCVSLRRRRRARVASVLTTLCAASLPPVLV